MSSYPIPPTPPGTDGAQWIFAIAAIRGYCGWHIAPTVTETVTVDGPGGRLLALPTQRLTALTVVNDGTPVTHPDWSTNGLVRGGWSTKYRGIEATMTHGYEMWPEELEQLALEIISASARVGVSQVSSGPHQVSFETSMTVAQRNTLGRYRLVGLP